MHRKFKAVITILAVAGAMLVSGGTATANTESCGPAANVYAYGNWECGTPNGWSPWGGIRKHDDESFRRITFETRQGNFAGRFQVDPGDVPPNTGGAERAEVYGLPGATMTEGDSAYYAFSIQFGNKWQQVTGSSIIVAQWRANNLGTVGSPPLALFVPSETADRLRLQQRAGDCSTLPCSYDKGHTVMTGDQFRATRGLWHDFILYVDWSATNGRVKMWHRLEGESEMTHLFDHQNVPTLNMVRGTIGAVYPKFGIYRTSPQPVSHTLYNDSYCVARLYAAALTCLPDE